MTTKTQLIEMAVDLGVSKAEVSKMKKAEVEALLDEMTSDTTPKGQHKDKASANANAQVSKANEFALKLFPSAKLTSLFASMSEARKAENDSKEARTAAAFDVVKLAVQFAYDNDDADTDTIVKGWKAHADVLATKLALSGSSMAEVVEGKDGVQTGRFVQYGQNVMSQAKGALEFEARFEGEGIVFDPATQPEAIAEQVELTKCDSYGEARKAVQAYRAARSEASKPALSDEEMAHDIAMLQLDEAWSELREIANEARDPAIIEQLLANISENRDVLVSYLNPTEEAKAA